MKYYVTDVFMRSEIMIRIGELKVTNKHKKVINNILDTCKFTEGPYVAQLEREMEKFLDVKHAILVTNGTVSLQLIGQLLFNNHGRQTVCVPAMTFPATINAFLITGHKVILCDIGDDLQMNLDSLDKETLKSIDILVPVHLMGYPVNMDKVIKYAKKYKWTVIEDAAEAFGATYNGEKVGSIGHFGSFSFYVSHNLWTGELGMITTNSDEDNTILRSMKNHGRTGDNMKFLHSYIGSNYKTTEFVAGIGLVNMKEVTKILKQRKDNAKYLQQNIKNFQLAPFPVTEDFSPLGYPILCKTEAYKNYITKKLNSNDIETRDIFPCLANQVAYKGKYNSKNFPIANRLEKTIFYVGIHQFMSKEDLKKIVDVINND
jgi:dTDP-4-amino-4,6-dideoxygalactose transaminase